jgi:hypothetical protein
MSEEDDRTRNQVSSSIWANAEDIFNPNKKLLSKQKILAKAPQENKENTKKSDKKENPVVKVKEEK